MEQHFYRSNTEEYTLLATLIDPSLKGAVFISPDNFKSAKTDLLEEAEKMSSNKTTSEGL